MAPSYLLAQRTVEPDQGFVHQVEDQGAGERHPLLLTAGKLRRAPRPKVGQLDRPRATFRAISSLPSLRTASGKARFSATVICGKSA